MPCQTPRVAACEAAEDLNALVPAVTPPVVTIERVIVPLAPEVATVQPVTEVTVPAASYSKLGLLAWLTRVTVAVGPQMNIFMPSAVLNQMSPTSCAVGVVPWAKTSTLVSAVACALAAALIAVMIAVSCTLTQAAPDQRNSLLPLEESIHMSPVSLAVGAVPWMNVMILVLAVPCAVAALVSAVVMAA